MLPSIFKRKKDKLELKVVEAPIAETTTFKNQNNYFVRLLKDPGKIEIVKSLLNDRSRLKSDMLEFLKEANKMQTLDLLLIIENMIIHPNDEVIARSSNSALNVLMHFPETMQSIREKNTEDELAQAVVLYGSHGYITNCEKLSKTEARKFIDELICTPFNDTLGKSDKIYLYLCREQGFTSIVGIL